jgi:hypothetical protein
MAFHSLIAQRTLEVLVAPWSRLTVQAGPANGWTFGAMQAWRGPLSGAILSHPTQISANPIKHFKISLTIYFIYYN